MQPRAIRWAFVAGMRAKAWLVFLDRCIDVGTAQLQPAVQSSASSMLHRTLRVEPQTLQVDMIVCYDASASPGRNIQRMGRTGRHGVGRIVYVLAAGKEVEKYKRSLSVRQLDGAFLLPNAVVLRSHPRPTPMASPCPC